MGRISGVAGISWQEIGDYFTILLVLAKTAHFRSTFNQSYAAVTSRIVLGLPMSLC